MDPLPNFVVAATTKFSCQNLQIFIKIPGNFANSLQIFWTSGNYLSFPGIPTKFREILNKKSRIFESVSETLQNFAKFKPDAM